MDVKKIVMDNLIYKTLTGSRAYGTFTESSDFDYRGIFCLPKHIRDDLFINIENIQDKSVDDIEYDELAKFIKLTADANPNKIELLYTLPEHHQYVHPAFQHILNNRDLFLSKKVRHTFGGYAFSQKSRIERHKVWLDKLENKTEKERLESMPSILSYIRGVSNKGFEMALDTKEQAFEKLSKCFATKVNHTTYKLYTLDKNFTKSVVDEVICENIKYIDIPYKELIKLDPVFEGVITFSFEAYQSALKEFNSYLIWRKERNPVRAELEAQFGMDCKHASHCVRLLKMCKELLTTGHCNVFRIDADELLAIRNGSMSYEQLMDFFEQTDVELNDLYKVSNLPKTPDLNKISDLYREALEIYDTKIL